MQPSFDANKSSQAQDSEARPQVPGPRVLDHKGWLRVILTRAGQFDGGGTCSCTLPRNGAGAKMFVGLRASKVLLQNDSVASYNSRRVGLRG